MKPSTSTNGAVTAAQVMTREVLTVGADWPIERLVEFLTNHSISGAPVVSDARKPIGVISLTDVARNGGLGEHGSAEVHGFYRNELSSLVARDEMRGLHVDAESTTTVKDIMTPLVFSVAEDATVQEVAEAMITGRIHRVFVTREGALVGIISAMDLLPLVRDM
jgi:CBS domain-containing protein